MHRHAFSCPPGFIFKSRALYRARSCLPYPTMGDTHCFPTAEGSTKIHIMNYIWSNQKPMTKAQQHEVSKPHSGHTFIPWSPAICCLLSNQPRRINKILNTSTLAKGLEVCLEGQHAWQEKAGQSPEALGAGCVDWVLYEGEGIWEEPLNLLAAQWYPRVSVNTTGGGATEGTVALTCWGWLLILIQSQPVREGNWTPERHVWPQPT